MPQVELINTIEIPALAICFCPMKNGDKLMGSCLECNSYMGLVEVDGHKKDASFGDKYRLVCAAPIPRRISVIEG